MDIRVTHTVGRALLFFCLLLIVLPGCRSHGPREVSEPTRRVIYNSDGVNMFIDVVPPMSPDDLYRYVDEVAGTQVTTFFMDPQYCMPMLYPGGVTEMIGSDMTADQWAEVLRVASEPDKKGSIERALANLRGLVEAGHDPVGLVVDRARAKGMEVFITFRLNEIHDVHVEDTLLVSRFWKANPAWRVGEAGDEILPKFRQIIGGREDYKVNPVVASWFPGALNFAVPQVRAHRLAELREVCERYDIDGIDLDFQRFPIYFPQDEGPEHIETMTGWVRQVREMTREVGAARGRPLLVSARVLATPEQNRSIGLAPSAWAREGLVDFLTVSHYLRNDFTLPIGAFRERVPAGVPLYGSIEVEKSRDRFRQVARDLWAAGADGVMLFNFFTSRHNRNEEPFFDLLNELGDPATIGDVRAGD